MKTLSRLFISLALIIFRASGIVCNAQLPQEQLLWPNGIPGNPVKYKEEKVRTESFRQSSITLRSKAAELGIDENKIGIAGFSAGGSLSLMATLGIYETELPAYAVFNKVNTNPDFTGLFYPGLNPGLINMVSKKKSFLPVFIMNGGEDTTTPAGNCNELYNVLTSKKFRAELHIYAKGGHGFDSGLERGYAISTWRDSFIAWLKDEGFIKE